MVDVKDISWGSYRSWSGPYYYGKVEHALPLPDPHGMLDEAVYVTAEAEGVATSVNAYDVCIMTLGAIQFCDRAPQLSATKLLGYVAANHSDKDHVISALAPALEASAATFRPNDKGEWRFYLGTRRVDSKSRQRELYMKGASGKKGQWRTEQKAHARLWAACLASVFEDEEARALQAEYTKPRMMSFVGSRAKALLFDRLDDSVSQADPTWVRALRVAYITFGVNNPKWAQQAVLHAHRKSKQPKWSPAYVIDCLRELVYRKGITIYPHRYHGIRPVLEELYGIYLPIKAAELRTAGRFIDASKGLFHCLKSVQAALERLGFDPGRIDGVMGGKTSAAAMAFQEANNSESPPLSRLPTSGILTDLTLSVLADAERLRRVQEDEPVTLPPQDEPSEVSDDGGVEPPSNVVDSPRGEPVVEATDPEPDGDVPGKEDAGGDQHIVVKIAMAIWGFIQQILAWKKGQA